MGVHNRGAWLCCAVLIVWCATAAVCSPVAQRPAPRKRVTYPRVVTEPTTVESAAYDVADRAPFDSSKNEGTTDETTTAPAEDTSSPLLASLDDGLLGSMDTMNSTFNDTIDLKGETAGSEPADYLTEDNLIFACGNSFARVYLSLTEEDCMSVGVTWSEDPENDEQTEDKDYNYLEEEEGAEGAEEAEEEVEEHAVKTADE